MPELPEVEHAAGTLRRWLGRVTIAGAEAGRGNTFADEAARARWRALRGRRLRALERRGKYLLWAMDGGEGVVSHLGMTGKWTRAEAGEPAPPHARATLALSDGRRVHLVDPRGFGRVEPLGACGASPSAVLAALRARAPLCDLGPEPWPEAPSAALLRERLAGTGRAVKVALMDGAVLAGLGNIQATEALFRARIHPAAPARELDAAALRRLARGIAESLRHTFACIADEAGEGAMTYLSEGADENPFLAYGREGEPCPRCRAELRALRLGGRTSVYCARCQPLQRSASGAVLGKREM